MSRPQAFRRGSHVSVFLGRRTGFTLWRRGAVSFFVRGRFLQIVLGDWWKAHDEIALRRRDHRRATAGQPRVRVTIDGTDIGPYPYHVGQAAEQLAGGRWS